MMLILVKHTFKWCKTIVIGWLKTSGLGRMEHDNILLFNRNPSSNVTNLKIQIKLILKLSNYNNHSTFFKLNFTSKGAKRISNCDLIISNCIICIITNKNVVVESSKFNIVQYLFCHEICFKMFAIYLKKKNHFTFLTSIYVVR